MARRAQSPVLADAAALADRPDVHRATQHRAHHRQSQELWGAARHPRALPGCTDATGVQSCDLRQGARAARAADAASRARRRRLDGQPPCRWVSYGGQYAEGSTRMIVTLLIASLAVVLRIKKPRKAARSRLRSA